MSKLSVAALVLVVAFGLVTPALANTIGPNGETLSLVFLGQSGNSYTFQLTVNTTTAGVVLDNAFLDSVALKISSNLITSSATGPVALSQNPNQQVNAGGGGSIGCGGGGSGWVCGEVTVANALPLGPNGAVYTFTFVIQTSAASPNLTSPTSRSATATGPQARTAKWAASFPSRYLPPPRFPSPPPWCSLGLDCSVLEPLCAAAG